MHARFSASALLLLAVLAGPAVPESHAQARLPVPGEKLAPLTPVYDGWYQNPDGKTATMVFGYLNRHNAKIEVPVGPDTNWLNPRLDSRVQPPTAFLPGRQQNVIKIVVPLDYPESVTWMIAYGGFKETTTQRGGLNPTVMMADPSPSVEAGPAQTIKVSETAKLSGTARADNLPEGVELRFLWSKVGGPGTVTFGSPSSPQTTATFSAPGVYTLRLAAGPTGSPDFNTRDEVKVTVAP